MTNEALKSELRESAIIMANLPIEFGVACITDAGAQRIAKVLTDAATALEAMEAGGWRPIETAPKDAHALLWIDIAIGQPLVVQGCWFHDDDADEKGWIDLDGNVLNATHWTPLPTPPKD